MSLPPEFLDQVKARTTLSALVGRTVKLTRAGREFKGLCPVHSEQSPSFTVNDDKGFAHCFGCGFHADAFRWLTDIGGLTFIDAVKELAAAAGMDVPAPSPEAAQRAARVETVRGALETAQAIYSRQLAETGAVLEYLSGRGIGPDAIARWGIGFARGREGSLKGSGIGQSLGQEAGILVEREQIGAAGTAISELLWDRITVPIHDRRGALAGFAGRVWPGRTGQQPKFINSPDGPLFDKGSLLFGHHLAAERLRDLRQARAERGAGIQASLIICEGYFDVMALDRAGFAAVAPMGTAITARQLEAAWRMHHRPCLLLDGDKAGQAAALRACKTALAGAGAQGIGPGRELAVAVLPGGSDPDDLLRQSDGLAELDACLQEARPLHGFVFERIVAEAGDGPEATAGIWHELSELAATIADEETRAQYLGLWRARFERECSAQRLAGGAALLPAEQLHSVTRADDGDYVFPESASDSEARFYALVRTALRKRAERRAITEELGDLMKMAEAVGFVKTELNAVIRDIESDLAKGPAVREEAEMVRVLYRRVLGIKGPMTEAMMPTVTDARARPASATLKRRATMHALIDARALDV